MLEAAQQRQREGVEVVVGVVETNGRPETEALLTGLEIVPRRKIEYRSKVLEEMDLDATLARRPQLVVVDELAHTNVSGSRHRKRYLDVEELLASGIDVYTTRRCGSWPCGGRPSASMTRCNATCRPMPSPGPWPVGERIIVCVSLSPLSPRLVRTARRMADRRHAEWMAVYVETPRHYRLSGADRDRVAQTLHLAEQLGGEAVTIPGHNMGEDLIRYAQSRNVTELIIGKSRRSRWSEIWRGSVAHQVIRKSGNIDVYVISGEDEPAQGVQGVVPSRRSLRQLNAYLGSALAVALAGLDTKLIESVLPLPNLSLVFLTSVLFSAVTWGLGRRSSPPC